jgi:hypothetical protein
VIDKLDPYELIGVVAPGSVLLFGGMLLFPAVRAGLGGDGINLGGLGVFVILSFVAGHLVHALGNLVEPLIWRPFGGMPTSWVLLPEQRLLDQGQLARLRVACSRQLGAELSQLDARQWSALTRELYSIVKNRGSVQRIDAFNRTYGFMRGIGVAFMVLSAIAVWQDPSSWMWAIIGIAVAMLAFYRMVRFGERYGRELLVEFIQVSSEAHRSAS